MTTSVTRPFGPAALLAAGLLLTGAAARADGPADTLMQAGVVATWAQDCGKPRSRENPHVSYLIEAGTAYYQTDGGPAGQLKVRIVRAERKPGRVLVEWQNGLVLETVQETDRIRGWQSVQADGTALIRDGIMLRLSQPTPWLYRCALGAPLS